MVRYLLWALSVGLLTPWVMPILTMKLGFSVEAAGLISTGHEVASSLGSLFLISRFGSKNNKWQAFTGRAFFWVSLADFTYGLVTYVFRIPSPREYIPLIHEIPYVLFVWYLGFATWKRAKDSTIEIRTISILVGTVSALFLICSYKMVLSPFFHDHLRRPLIMYFTSTAYAVGQSFAVGSLFVATLRSMEFSELFLWMSFLVLIASDFALRYQDLGNVITQIPIFEYGWEFALSTILLNLFLKVTGSNLLNFVTPAPMYSIRVITPSLSLLALIGFSVASVSITSYLDFATGATVGGYILVFMIIWALSNFLSLGLSRFVSKQVQELSSAILSFTSENKKYSSGLLEMSPSIHFLEQAQKRLFNEIEKNYLLATDAKIGKLASQVAHDIRSPLTALDIAAAEVKDLPEENRILIRSATKRIKDITNSLLKLRAQELEAIRQGGKVQPELLYSLVEEVVSEKRIQLKSAAKIEIDFFTDQTASSSFSTIDGVAFKSAISNLIENSIEASLPGGKILVDLTSNENTCLISVEDNGSGVPGDLIDQIVREGFSHNKVGGNGLGLTFAHNFAVESKGRLRISSEESFGTKIVLELPRANIPGWFCSELDGAGKDSSVIIVDDDLTVHQIWQKRFEGFCAPLFHFYDWDQFYRWQETQGASDNRIFLLDFEFKGIAERGTDLIKRLEIEKFSTLVTSHYENLGLRKFCVDEGVRMLPKALAGMVPIVGFTRVVEFKEGQSETGAKPLGFS